jgi:predicted transcriptional regulator of viral defense system
MFSLAVRLHALARKAKHGVFSVEEAKGWQLCSERVLRVTLARMAEKGLVKRLGRGLYFAPPLEQPQAQVDDLMYAAQRLLGGYLAFATALYLHRLREEVPYTIYVATFGESGSRKFGEIEVKAVALRKAAVGVQRINDYVVSTRAKTLFDCLSLPRYGGGASSLVQAFKKAKLTDWEWREFFGYVKKFRGKNKAFKKRVVKVIEESRLPEARRWLKQLRRWNDFN